MLACIVSTFIFWEIAKRVILYADKYYPWERDLLKRIVFQWLTTFGIITPLQIVIIFVYNFHIVYRPENFDFSAVFYTDVPLVWLLFSVMQMIYAVLYLRNFIQIIENKQSDEINQLVNDYQQLCITYEALKAQLAILQANFLATKDTQKIEASTTSSQEQHLLVQQGNALIPLVLKEVAYIFKINDFTLIRTFERKDFGIDATLEKLEEILPKKDFFRLNRQMIVSKKSVKQIKPENYGKLNVELTPTYEEEAGVSRTKAQEFRQWLGLNL
jgi:DNA-binding LytR/AlgR family response regulator